MALARTVELNVVGAVERELVDRPFGNCNFTTVFA
jgi:hypothetical protein